jgi:hypothetical protein
VSGPGLSCSTKFFKNEICISYSQLSPGGASPALRKAFFLSVHLKSSRASQVRASSRGHYKCKAQMQLSQACLRKSLNISQRVFW